MRKDRINQRLVATTPQAYVKSYVETPRYREHVFNLVLFSSAAIPRLQPMREQIIVSIGD
jgi:hypothetical protein